MFSHIKEAWKILYNQETIPEPFAEALRSAFQSSLNLKQLKLSRQELLKSIAEIDKLIADEEAF